MLKVLIVDDEPIIREGLKTLISWEEYGYEICGDAANGKEGADKVEKLKPDLVIVDIKMPVMDGLMMIEILKKQNVKSKFIVLTGYSEFEYAKKALECGVTSYILKPINEDELIDKINKIYKEIEASRKNEVFLSRGISFLREQIIEKLVLEKIELEVAREKYEWLELPWSSYQVVLIEIERGSNVKSDTRNEVKLTFEKFVNDNQCGYVFTSSDKIGILLKNIFFSSIRRSIELIQRCIQKKEDTDIFIAVGRYVTDFYDICFSYEDASIILDNGFILSAEKIVDIEEYKELTMRDFNNTFENSCINDIMEKIYIAIDTNNKEYLDDILNEVFKNIKDCYSAENNIKAGFAYIYTNIMNELRIKNDEFKSSEYMNENVFKEIYKKETLDELYEYIRIKFSAILDSIADSRPDSTIKKIIDYVDRNYNIDIKLETLANTFGYNSAYLGKQFKKYTGEYFNTYVDKLRIKHAKQLLREGFKIYKTAEVVGYKDNDYFTLKFKKYMGLSPSDYKKKVASIETN